MTRHDPPETLAFTPHALADDIDARCYRWPAFACLVLLGLLVLVCNMWPGCGS